MDLESAISQACDGDEKGFAWLFERYKRPVFRFIKQRSALIDDEAEEVLQSTFIRAFRGLPRLRAAACFEVWLLRIARREVFRLTERRRNMLEPLESAIDAACDQQERMEEDRERERLLEVLRSLAEAVEPVELRETARRYYLGEACTTEAVAAELGVPHATVRKRLYLFRNKLRARLQLEAE